MRAQSLYRTVHPDPVPTSSPAGVMMSASLPPPDRKDR